MSDEFEILMDDCGNTIAFCWSFDWMKARQPYSGLCTGSSKKDDHPGIMN